MIFVNSTRSVPRAFPLGLLLLLLLMATRTAAQSSCICPTVPDDPIPPSTTIFGATCAVPVVDNCLPPSLPICLCTDSLTISIETGSITCTDAGECVECSDASHCSGTDICCPEDNTCGPPGIKDPSACGDPHMTGFLGQKFDFTGEDGAWYALISDLPALHLNMRVTAPVPSMPEITYITGLAVTTTDKDDFEHTIVISVSDPHTLASSCPAGVSPCLADGSLHVVADGEEVLVSPGTATLAPDIAVSSLNIPGACRSFGFEKYWELKQLEQAQHGRHMLENRMQDMADWILGDPTATNMEECAEYVARTAIATDGNDLFAHQSEHASFQIVTPTCTIRLSHGRLHQLATRDPTDEFDIPDHLTWQMNLGLDYHSVSPDAKGVLGETLVPTRDASGNPIMHGLESIRGTQEEYRVEGPLGVSFAQD